MASLTNITAGEQWQLLGRLSQAGLTAEQAREINKSEALATIMVSALKAELAKAVEPERPSITSFDPIRVDYSVRPTDTELLKQEFDRVSDGYVEGTDWQRDERCKDVPNDGEHEVIFELVRFNKVLTTRQILEKLDAEGLRPATFEEIRAFAKAHPDLQKEFWIVGLGTSCHWLGDRYVPCLGWYGRERDLSLNYDDPGDGWYASDRFLAVRK